MSSEFNTSRPITDDLEANPIILTATSDSSELTLLRVTYLETEWRSKRKSNTVDCKIILKNYNYHKKFKKIEKMSSPLKFGTVAYGKVHVGIRN